MEPAVVTWDNSKNAPANPDVYTWYQNLYDCYKSVYDEVVGSNPATAEDFLEVSYIMNSTVNVRLVPRYYGKLVLLW